MDNYSYNYSSGGNNMIIHAIHEILHRYSIEQLEMFLDCIKSDDSATFFQLESKLEIIDFLEKEIVRKKNNFIE